MEVENLTLYEKPIQTETTTFFYSYVETKVIISVNTEWSLIDKRKQTEYRDQERG